jgi:hypothetical protein
MQPRAALAIGHAVLDGARFRALLSPVLTQGAAQGAPIFSVANLPY